MKRIFMVLVLFVLIGTANASIIDCDNCTDCNSKILNATMDGTADQSEINTVITALSNEV